MKRSLMFIFVLTVLFSFLCLAGDAVNVTGKWEITSESPRGKRTRDVEFVQDGENLIVIMQSRRGGTMEAKGTVKGSTIEWSVTRETPRGTFTMAYKGTVDGDTIKGEVDFAGRGSMEWTAARKKEEKK